MLRKKYSKIRKSNLLLNNRINNIQNNRDNVNPFNIFLSTLDKKSNNFIENKKENNKKSCIELEKLLNKIDQDYNKHLNILKSNIDKTNSLNNINPNLYLDSINSINSINNLHANQRENSIDSTKMTKIDKVNIDVEINNIDDLINIIEKYKIEPNVEYNIDMKSLHNIKDNLIELNNMIGMNNLKNNIVDQILYFSQNLHKSSNSNCDGDFLHTVIYGPPGTGKTEIAKIIGKIYSKIGILTNGTFKKVTRSDLIAGYLGQTALKTKDVIKESIGGVLFIDEAYSLGNNEKRDSFSKECIDTLCEALSDHKNDLMVIIAGYENELKDCFFDYNQGLDSRFTWRFKTDEYKSEELFEIFVKKVKDIGWNIDEKSGIDHKWFESKMDYFKFYGRDIETLLSKTKIVHSKRVFCKPQSYKKIINLQDLNAGFDKYLNNNDVIKRKEKQELNKTLYSMYI